MARIITQADIATQSLSGSQLYWTYNGLDCCVTHEVWGVLHPRLSRWTKHIYYFQMGLQAPAMAMMFRGVPVDDNGKEHAITILASDLTQLQSDIQDRVRAHGWNLTTLNHGKCPSAPEKPHNWPRDIDPGDAVCKRCGAPRTILKTFNANSDLDCKAFFYDIVGLNEMYGKKGNVSVDKEILDRIEARYDNLADVVAAIKAIRGNRKQSSVLRSGVSSDGRMRSTFVIGGAETGRQSSTANPYDEGTNLQNIAEKLRYVFKSDPGRVMFYADLEQAESNGVAHLAGDEAYIAAHRDGDVHTAVCRLVWPELPWSGDLKKDKILADTTYPDWDPDHSYRLNSKRLQHGSNYMLTPRGMSRIAHIPVRAAEENQAKYFDAFPGIRSWQRATYHKVKETGMLVSCMGRQRQFFGRIWDDHTVKQAVAQEPQSMVADILNTAMWHIWYDMDPRLVWLYAQVHDALLGSVMIGSADRDLAKMLAHMSVPVKITGVDGKERTMVIATDVKTGDNWGKKSDTNPGGMK